MTDLFDVLARMVDRRLRRGTIDQSTQERLTRLLSFYTDSESDASIKSEKLKLVTAPIRDAMRLTIIAPGLLGYTAPLTDRQKNDLIRELGAAGGTSSGKTRRAEAEEGWRPHALKLSIIIRKEDKGITQTSLAAEIKSRWTLKLQCPSSQLIPAISRWEREGKLARRDKG